MGRRIAIAVMIIIVALVIFLGGWALTYRSPSDPKNIEYVLWKMGLYKLDVDQATSAMVGDPGRKGLVIGRTKRQLLTKFGSLLSPAEASPYLRECYRRSSWSGREVLFIGHSSWMVVFNGDTATDLVLVKGC